MCERLYIRAYVRECSAKCAIAVQKQRGAEREALLQNGTFVILRPAVVCRILLLEEIPP